MCVPGDILSFWFDELGPEKWYFAGDEVDQLCTDRFLSDWKALKAGKLEDWRSRSEYSLAYVILADQLPRNMFRDTDQAFQTDWMALRAAKDAIHYGWDLKQSYERRHFFYLPFMHSENLVEQNRGVRLNLTRMGPSAENSVLHACAHRNVIRSYGRFPFRNEALLRETTPDEQSFLDNGAYGSVVNELKELRQSAA